MITALFVVRIQNRAARGVIIGAASLIIAGVGLSRVYLGVHYPTDVLGGWSIALCWISFLLMFDKREDPQVPEPAEIENTNEGSRMAAVETRLAASLLIWFIFAAQR